MPNPLYTPKTKDQYTDPEEKHLYDDFAIRLGWGEEIHSRATFEFLMEVRRFAAGKILLDAGAGHKRFQPYFATAKRYLTVEHPSGIAMKGMEQETYDFIAELDGEPFTDDESIDVIYCHSVLEHVARPERFFANSLRMLRPGGRLYIHVPFMYPEHETPYDFNRLTRYGLKSRLEEAGFGIATLRPSSNSFYGSAAFVINSIRQEEQARGFTLSSIRLPDGSTTPVMPLLESIIKSIDSVFDDAIYDNLNPIGWLAVGEKPART